jgi:hypothetical protein
MVSSTNPDGAVKSALIENTTDKLADLEYIDESKENLRRIVGEGIKVNASTNRDNNEQVNIYEITFNGVEGSSTKPNNVKFNIKEFAKTVSTAAIGLGVISSYSLLIPAVVLGTILAGNDAVTVDLRRETLIVYSTMYRYSTRGSIHEDELDSKIKSFTEEHDITNNVGDEEIEIAIEKLEYIEAITINQTDDGKREFIPIESLTLEFE